MNIWLEMILVLVAIWLIGVGLLYSSVVIYGTRHRSGLKKVKIFGLTCLWPIIAFGWLPEFDPPPKKKSNT